MSLVFMKLKDIEKRHHFVPDFKLLQLKPGTKNLLDAFPRVPLLCKMVRWLGTFLAIIYNPPVHN